MVPRLPRGQTASCFPNVRDLPQAARQLAASTAGCIREGALSPTPRLG